MTVVSVIIPAFNAGGMIAESIASAAAQTLTDIEIIVIDDASTDDTAAVVAAMAGGEPRLRLLRQPVNRGPSSARNDGIAAARGRWLALLDADDGYAPDRLATLVALAEAQDADLCSDNLLLCPETLTAAGQPMIPRAVLDAPRPLELAEFVARNVADRRYPGMNFGFLKPIIRREFVIQHGIAYNEAVRFAEDFAFYVDCLLAGARWWLSPLAGYRYRQRPGTLTHVQTVADLAALRRKLAALQATTTSGSELAQLVARHQRVVARSYHYRSFTDALKQRRYAAAVRTLTAERTSAALIVAELARQAPVIIRKAARGGYLG